MADVGGGGRRGGGAKKTEGVVHKKKARPNVFIDMTPMVDVAFLLLIFFMVSTVFRAPQTMELNIPPDDESKVEIAESNVLVIRMLDDGKVYWNIGKMPPELVEFDEVRQLILDKDKENAERFSGVSKLVTLVKIHRSSPYEQMVNVMDELQLGSIDRFSIVVMEDKEVREVFGS